MKISTVQWSLYSIVSNWKLKAEFRSAMGSVNFIFYTAVYVAHLLFKQVFGFKKLFSQIQINYSDHSSGLQWNEYEYSVVF